MNKGLKLLLTIASLSFASISHADAIGSGEPQADDSASSESVTTESSWLDFFGSDDDAG